MRSRRSSVRFVAGHLSQKDLDLLNTIRECSVVVERLSDEFIQNAIASNNFASEKTKTKKIKTKRHRKSSEHKKKQKKRKYSESESEESDNNESDEDYVASSYTSSVSKRLLRSENIAIDNEFEPTPSKELFSCKNCVFVTNTEQHLLQHASRHKNICSFCQRQFGSNAECEAHLAESHTPIVEKIITYKCKKCKECFTVESEYKKHLISHLDISSETFSCCFCRSLFAKHTSLINHVQRAHIEYKCTFCDISAPKFEILERHCQTLHSYWGRPFECEFCDFKFAVFGVLQLHRSEYHAIEWDDGEDKCRFCHLVLGDYEKTIQHFAEHLKVSLFKCYLCEFTSNSGEEMKEHSRTEHSKLEIFAKQTEIQEFMELLKELIKNTFNQPIVEIKQTRQKPTANETREAIAMILTPTESLETIGDENFLENGIAFEQNHPEKNIQESNMTVEENNVIVDVDNQDMVKTTRSKSSISTLVKPLEGIKKLPKKKQTKGRKRKNLKVEEEKSEEKHETNGIIDDAFDAETDVESETDKKRAIMSVDPVTNRLYVNGLPVFDESGNEVFVVNQYVE